jgi:hypothetical protein
MLKPFPQLTGIERHGVDSHSDRLQRVLDSCRHDGRNWDTPGLAGTLRPDRVNR